MVQWKKIAELSLEPGDYTFTGLKNSTLDSISLRLNLQNSEGEVKNYWQYNEDIQFLIVDSCKAELYVRINPFAVVETVARPAVYRDE